MIYAIFNALSKNLLRHPSSAFYFFLLQVMPKASIEGFGENVFRGENGIHSEL